ncbi:hypothetical protein GCM10009541_39770 [Micromonospora gifhornensis]|uniref:Uncharacterized protein n=1 Tax=Micromonospora gifhornensis TaxID=84594 RepID=A0ABQ4IDU7_9ACTN|nr:hypothetical protein Vgi01_27770 [Micromonospora gifhornensis]
MRSTWQDVGRQALGSQEWTAAPLIRASGITERMIKADCGTTMIQPFGARDRPSLQQPSLPGCHTINMQPSYLWCLSQMTTVTTVVTTVA